MLHSIGQQFGKLSMATGLEEVSFHSKPKDKQCQRMLNLHHNCSHVSQFSHSVVSDSLQPHGLQHNRPPCPSRTPGVYPNSCPLSCWCQPTIPHLLSSPFPAAFNLSKHSVFSYESDLHIRWSKYWSFSCNISPSNEHSGWISFRMEWLDLLAVQGTLKNLIQHQSSKASILQHSASFIFQLSHIYMTTGKTTAFTQFCSVQSFGCVRLFATPWTAAHQASLSITNSWSLLKLMSIELVMPFNHFILCHPFLLLPSIFTTMGVFSSEPTLCMRWPKYWSFSFNISPSNDLSG